MKLSGTLAGEKNRLHKLLDSIGLRLGNVVSDIDGVSANAIITGIINQEPVDKLIGYLKGQLKKKESEIRKALAVTPGARDLFLLKKLHNHIEYLNTELSELDCYLLTAMQPYQTQWEILQTIPGLAPISAALLIIEMGVDMERFGSADSLSSWAAMCPGNNESAGKLRSDLYGIEEVSDICKEPLTNFIKLAQNLGNTLDACTDQLEEKLEQFNANINRK